MPSTKIGSTEYVIATTQFVVRRTSGWDVFPAVLRPICVTRDVRRAVKISQAFRIALEQYWTPCTASWIESTGALETQSL
jgi:hypothetical protein